MRGGELGEWNGVKCAWAVGSASERASGTCEPLGRGSGVGAEKDGARRGASVGEFVVWEGRGGEATGKSRLGPLGGRGTKALEGRVGDEVQKRRKVVWLGGFQL